MAENPATWGAAERVIQEALNSFAKAQAKGIVGRSQAKAIADALREASLLTESSSETTPVLRAVPKPAPPRF
jgi:hypothetical protein